MSGMRVKELYEDDFVAWTERQAHELRALHTSRWNGPLDLEHLAEEIEDLGRSQRHACESLLEQIIIHLLKLRWSKAKAPRTHWANEIDLCRNELHRRLTPTIRQRLETDLDTHYQTAARLTTRALAREEPDTRPDIPSDCPWSLEDILSSDMPLSSQCVPGTVNPERRPPFRPTAHSCIRGDRFEKYTDA
jgi:hypothetical protein